MFLKLLVFNWFILPCEFCSFSTFQGRVSEVDLRVDCSHTGLTLTFDVLFLNYDFLK